MKASEKLNKLVLEQLVERAKQKLPEETKRIAYGLWKAIKAGDNFYLLSVKEILLKAGLIKQVEDSSFKDSPIDGPVGIVEFEPTDKARELYQRLEREGYFKGFI